MVEHVNLSSGVRFGARRAATLLALALTLSVALAGSAFAASPVPLGTADSFALLGGSTITNGGSTTITGDIGLCCTGVAMTGFGPGADQVNQLSGARYAGTGTSAATAQDDLDIAYGDAAGQAPTAMVPVDLSLTGTPANPLLPGVYESTAHGAFQINTGLTLDFQGNPNAVFIFQGTALVTAAAAAGSMTIVNGGATPSTCNIYWQLSDATQGVTLGAGSAFMGTTMSLGASVLGTGATVEGRILTRRSKAVNLHANTITRSACSVAAPGGGAGAPIPSAGTPAPPAGTATPPSGTPAPPAGTPAPPSGTATPPSGTPAPPVATPTPPVDTPAPASSSTPVDSPIAATPAALGTARLSGPSGPVSAPFRVFVTGRAIAQVVFYIDGRRVSTVHAKPGRTKFSVTIHPRKHSHRVHHVQARVTYTTPGTGTTTKRLTYRRPLTPHTPRFTG